MPDNYIGEITPFGGNFAIRGWSTCAGQLLSISTHTALFSILGTTYGGDGISTFGLPDLRGRAIINAGHGPGLSNYNLGQKSGAETVTLTSNQLPSHNHSGVAAPGPPTQPSVDSNASLPTSTSSPIYATGTPTIAMNAGVIGNTGGSQSHTNIQPYLAITYLIALEGVYPSRS
jgi:microcystin-dependent protein